ncbi:unnamed protein product [Mytilus coruscus]|uniref:PHD-type domain-containing protein n=1 Tax=Mytilus coruscus TaxID=42192 RepID=A0A6J8BJA8_MYTCO|nr:unnamed protein product [Mytilus coruscus]
MEDTKLNTGGTEDMEGCQILQNHNEEVVECPECLHNFKCALCYSKNQTVKEMRSKSERDNIQIKQVMSQQKETEKLFVDEPCDVCGFKEKDDGNELVYCEECNVLVHQACYNIPVVPDDDWFCRPCSEGVQPKCVLCDQMKGAMVKTSNGKEWVHVQCVWWLPDIKFVDGKKMEKMERLQKISKDKDEGNELVYCENCDVLVHQACYNIPVVPDDDWFCRPCSEGVQPKCVLCNQVKGAMVKTSDGKKWAHVQCVWWLPDIKFEDGKKMERMESLDKISPDMLFFRKGGGSWNAVSVKNIKVLVFNVALKVASRLSTVDVLLKTDCLCKLLKNPYYNLSESLKKKRKVGDKRTPDITLEQITSKNDRGDTCLHVAALTSDLKQIYHLLDRISKASLIQNCIDIQNKKSMTPLFISVLNNDSDIVEIFLQHGANPNIFAQATEGQRDAAIHVAASRGSSYLKTVEALLADETIALNSFNKAGYTALHIAVMEHGRKISKKEKIHSDCIIEKLIVAGVDPNLQETKTGRTPLMCAIEKLDITLVEKFVKLIDHSKMRQLLKSETFDGKNVHSIIEELKDSFTKNDYKKLTDLLRNINEGPQ